MSRYQAYRRIISNILMKRASRRCVTAVLVGVLLPARFIFCARRQRPPVELLRRYQVPVAVASDFNPGTSPFCSLHLR
ncbi:imidazolonepropionase [Salmonella enterica subsp. enterica]|uniref:Imidazolonepropionase n=1 Tax=Salmonella enterica I TaxID=59201 RepID=A0A379WX31_SALET|nr:imidazolonepropionase [Salmonella enterica subsp. enterica]